MDAVLTFPNLESAAGWTKVIGPSINNVQAEDIGITQQVTADGPILRMTNFSTAQWGGGLAKLPIPVVNLGFALPYIGLDLEYRVREECLPLLGRLEADVKLCIAAAPSPTAPIPNIIDGSTQFNASEGWMLQIDKAGGGWIDTGYNPPKPEPDKWTPLALRFSYDPKALKFSVVSADAFAVPASLQNLPLLTTNWTGGALQLQTEVLAPGVVEVAYRKITLSLSTKPF